MTCCLSVSQVLICLVLSTTKRKYYESRYEYEQNMAIPPPPLTEKNEVMWYGHVLGIDSP